MKERCNGDGSIARRYNIGRVQPGAPHDGASPFLRFPGPRHGGLLKTPARAGLNTWELRGGRLATRVGRRAAEVWVAS